MDALKVRDKSSVQSKFRTVLADACDGLTFYKNGRAMLSKSDPSCRRFVSHLSLFLVAIALVGCDSVTVDQPFGEPASKELCSKLRGIWGDLEGNVYHVETKSDNDLVVAVTQWNSKKKKFTTRNIPMKLMVVGERPLLFFPADEGDNPTFAFLWLSQLDKDSLNARNPNADAFREAVESGQLQGKVVERKNDNFTVNLEATDGLLEKLSGTAGPEYFDEEDDDSVLRKVGSHDLN